MGLDLYDFHARGYDPALGRTWQIDPMSIKYYSLSPYSWVANNPLIKRYSEYKVYTNLDKALKNKSDVKILVLSGKELKEFPKEIIELSNLKVLNLTDNQIGNIPGEISSLKDLEMLELMKNNLDELPKSIIKLKKLERINVAYNNLSYEDVKFIKEELPNCLIITEIEL